MYTHSWSRKLGVADFLPTETGLKQALETVVTVGKMTSPAASNCTYMCHTDGRERFTAVEMIRLKDNPGNIAQGYSFCGVDYSICYKSQAATALMNF